MNPTFNILSIDFDFFQTTDTDTLSTCYPDGHDLSTELSKMVWAGYYAHPKTKDKINKVSIDISALHLLINLLKNCNPNIPVLVTNSHKHIYDFIKTNVEQMNDTDLTSHLNITNVDMHHDMFDDSNDIHCGNWLAHLSDEYPTKITWIANKISNDIFTKNFHNKDMVTIIKDDLSYINTENIDMLFVCRSDVWFPPHLDENFDYLLKFLCKHFKTIKGEKSICEPRDMTQLVNIQAKFYERVKNKDNG